MSANPFFSGRIPEELLKAIDEHRKLTSESKTEVLINSLAKYIGFQLPEKEKVEPPIQQKLSEIFKRLEFIEKELESQKNIKKPLLQKADQLTLNTDNNKITGDNKKPAENNLSKFEILETAKVIKKVKVSQSSLSSWKKENKFPKIFKGYKIEFDHQEKCPRNSYWKVTKV